MRVGAFILAAVSVVGLEWWLIRSGQLSALQAFAIFVSVEGLLVGGVLCQSWVNARRSNSTLVEQLPALKLIRHEWWILKDFYQLLRRKRIVPDGAVILQAHQSWWQLPAMFTVAIAIEIVVVDLMLPWPAMRVIVLALSLYGMVIMWGMIAGRVVHPHYLTNELVLRDGRTVICRVPVSEILELRRERSFHSSQHAVENDHLILGGAEGTNMSVIFRQAQDTALPRWPWQPRHTQPVTACALWLDEPESLRHLDS